MAIAGLPSSVISPLGKEIASSTNYFDFVTKTINLDCSVVHLDYSRERLKAMKKKYRERVKSVDPSYLGSVLISSETEEFNIKKLIEQLDDYMEKALAHHHNPENMGP